MRLPIFKLVIAWVRRLILIFKTALSILKNLFNVSLLKVHNINIIIIKITTFISCYLQDSKKHFTSLEIKNKTTRLSFLLPQMLKLSIDYLVLGI